MIYLYVGTPGSGKSLDTAQTIIDTLRGGRNVIGTMIINKDLVSKYKGEYIFVDIYSLRPDELVAYARKYHVKGKEGQCLLVVDESQRIFGAREWNAKDRRTWNNFFQVHRHFGYDVYLITQTDRLLDRQILSLIEYRYIHRKIGNFGLKGRLLSMIFRGGLFISVSEWYPVHEKIGSRFFVFNKRCMGIYDSYAEFDVQEESFNELQEYLSSDMGGGGHGERGPVADTDHGSQQIVPEGDCNVCPGNV